MKHDFKCIEDYQKTDADSYRFWVVKNIGKVNLPKFSKHRLLLEFEFGDRLYHKIEKMTIDVAIDSNIVDVYLTWMEDGKKHESAMTLEETALENIISEAIVTSTDAIVLDEPFDMNSVYGKVYGKEGSHQDEFDGIKIDDNIFKCMNNIEHSLNSIGNTLDKMGDRMTKNMNRISEMIDKTLKNHNKK